MPFVHVAAVDGADAKTRPDEHRISRITFAEISAELSSGWNGFNGLGLTSICSIMFAIYFLTFGFIHFFFNFSFGGTHMVAV